MSKRKDFSLDTKLKVLSLCDRHCCLCGKQCGINIIVHHLEDNSNNDIDNAIPLCFVCHGQVGMYNEKHAVGNKYSIKELKQRRKQIYDKYTSPFMPNIHYEIKSLYNNDIRKSVFIIVNKHQYLPCKVRTVFSLYRHEKLKCKINKGCYGGEQLWFMNPGFVASMPARSFLDFIKLPKQIKELRVEIEVSVIDKLGWEHKLLPVSWIYNPDYGWYLKNEY